MYYVSDAEMCNTHEGREQARGHLLAYASICQEERAYELLTPNLHIADCQMLCQEEYAGRRRQMGKLFVERAMRVVASTDCAKSPESTLAIRYLLLMSIENAKNSTRNGFFFAKNTGFVYFAH